MKAKEVTNTFLDVAGMILDSLVIVVNVVGILKEIKGTINAVIGGITYRHDRSM